MPHLFEPFKQRGLTFRNRIGVSPMCQYSSVEGRASDWHLVHLGTRAIGGAGMVMMEATAVEPRGRITPGDNGIWSDDHIEPLRRVTSFIREHGAVAAIQLAHAGRKASRGIPWVEDKNLTAAEGGWQVIGPSAIPFAEGYQTPHEMTTAEIRQAIDEFGQAARRAREAGFQVVEIHGAHGYLINSFLSPLSNQRKDEYGGSFENRIRFIVEIAKRVRKEWPNDLPVWARLSSVDWVSGGWAIEDSVELAKRLKAAGVDLIDCSSGGNSPLQKIPVGAGYQVQFAETIRVQADVPTAAVGLITSSAQADETVRNGRADIVLLARELLRDPYWPLHAAKELHQAKLAPVPSQYLRAF